MIISDDNVWELFQRADPARRPDITPITDAATYLDGLRSSDAAVTRIDDGPSSRSPTWLGWPLASAAAIAAVIAAGGARSRHPRRRTGCHGRGGDRIGLGGFAADAVLPRLGHRRTDCAE